MYKKKVCMVGEFAVGKTSLVERYVHSIFSDRYLTTVGVKIDKKQLEVDGDSLQLLLWDIQGEDELGAVPMNYLKGAAGILYVVDGTRGHTLDTALRLRARIDNSFSAEMPAVILLNKTDLSAQWEIDTRRVAEPGIGGLPILHTSSKDGVGVDAAFETISRMMLGKPVQFAA